MINCEYFYHAAENIELSGFQLQLWFVCAAGLVGPAPDSVRWTCLMMDLCFMLTFYLNRHHAHLKSVKLCANMAVKNMFTSDLLLDPGESQTTKGTVPTQALLHLQTIKKH